MSRFKSRREETVAIKQALAKAGIKKCEVWHRGMWVHVNVGEISEELGKKAKRIIIDVTGASSYYDSEAQMDFYPVIVTHTPFSPPRGKPKTTLKGTAQVVNRERKEFGVSKSGKQRWIETTTFKKGDFYYVFTKQWNGWYGGYRMTTKQLEHGRFFPRTKYCTSIEELMNRFPVMKDEIKRLYSGK